MPFRFANHLSRADTKPYQSTLWMYLPFSLTSSPSSQDRAATFCFLLPFPPTLFCHHKSFLRLEVEPRLPRMAQKTLPKPTLASLCSFRFFQVPQLPATHNHSSFSETSISSTLQLFSPYTISKVPYCSPLSISSSNSYYWTMCKALSIMHQLL